MPQLHYPDGYALAVEGARVVSAPGAALLKLENLRGVTQVTVRITPE